MIKSFTAQPPYRHVIVATDGSQLSGTALLGGSMLAEKTSAQLLVFHASLGDDTESSVVAHASAVLEGRPFKLTVRSLVAAAAPTPAQMIAEFATEVDGEAIVVIGTHGRGSLGVSLLGSTAVELVSGANRPIVAYGPEARPPVNIGRVVACVDGSPFSELSVIEGARWADALKVPLWLIQVVPPDFASSAAFESNYVHNIAKDLHGLSSAIEWDVLHSDSPARSILDWQGEDPATMLVMTTHGRVGVRRVLLGSVSSQVVKETGGPVVLVRPPVSQ